MGDHHADVAALLALDAHRLRRDPRLPRRQEGADDLARSGPCRSDSPAARSRPRRGRGSASRLRASRCTRDSRRPPATNSSTSAKFRSAWIPPAVAQAPIVIRVRELARTWRIRSASAARRHRALDQRDVVGPLHGRRGRFEEMGDLDRPGEREQLVLEVEQLRAGSRRRRRTSRPRAAASPRARSSLPHRERRGDLLPARTRARRGRRRCPRAGSARSGPTAQRMLRSSET